MRAGLLLIAFALAPGAALADFTGRVVKVSDGDTLTVLVQKTQIRVRLDPALRSPIPELFEPVLLGFFPLAFRLRGFERLERGTAVSGVVQEWHCEVP